MKVFREDFPDDEDGEVLYMVASNGIDLTCKREIRFYCYSSDEVVAQRIVDDLASYGYDSLVFIDENDGESTSTSVYSAITMLPMYELIVLEQQRLDLILQPYNTSCDGWMTES